MIFYPGPRTRNQHRFLAQIKVWALADSKRQGFLGFKEFITAMQLESLAQDGNELTPEILKTTVDLSILKPPMMAGLDSLINKVPKIDNELETNGSAQSQAPPSEQICFIAGLVMSLIGSLLSILVAVIMPALCFLRIVKKATKTQIILSATVAVLGSACAILGTYSSLSEIAKNY